MKEHKVFYQDPIDEKKCNYKCVYWEVGAWCKVEKCKFKLKKKYRAK